MNKNPDYSGGHTTYQSHYNQQRKKIKIMMSQY
jgi:hypothetical protein